MAIISSRDAANSSSASPDTKKESVKRAPSVQVDRIPEETPQEISLRPTQWDDYIGQNLLKQRLNISIQAAKSRNQPLRHVLLYGPPGLGKTTLAMIIAAQMGSPLKITSAPAMEKPRDIIGLLMRLPPGGILFVDEIHRLNRLSEELLYTALEDFRLDMNIGTGATAQTRSIPLKPFTLIGATTKIGSLSSPLQMRFSICQKLDYYSPEDLALILSRDAQILNFQISSAAAFEIASRSRGTPRIAIRLLRLVQDYVQVHHLDLCVTPEIAQEALALFGIDSIGLDDADRQILQVLLDSPNDRPVGIEALAALLGEDAQTLEEVYEPYLLQIGYLERTSRGRIATQRARDHLNRSQHEENLV